MLVKVRTAAGRGVGSWLRRRSRLGGAAPVVPFGDAASVASAPGDGRRDGPARSAGTRGLHDLRPCGFCEQCHRRRRRGARGARERLPLSRPTRRASSCSAHGFDDALPENPKAKVFLDAMPTLARSNLGTHLARCASELPLLPVVTSNDAYRLGNAVERQGVGWIGARRLVLEENAGYEGSILYDFLMGENEDQRAFVGSVVAKKRRMASEDLETTASLHGDNNTIVIPLRLSDKVRFMVEDYPVINTAVVEYKEVLSLVHGLGDHDAAGLGRGQEPHVRVQL